MPIMKWEKDESVAILTMTNGPNKMDLEFAQTMLATLDQIEADESIKALVITANDEKNWSQGINLDWLLGKMGEGDKESVKAFLYGINDVFKRLLLYPLPVIAAINGHAFGDGTMMACACDFRFMRSDKGFFCFPEVDLGIPFLPGMNAFLKKAIPYYKLQEMQLNGKRCTASEMEEHKVLVKACADLEDLMASSVAFAKTFDKKRKIFGELKQGLYKDIIDIMDTQDPPKIESAF
jgi:enoyl-CoA hydratase/carnithine racemase